MQILLENLCLCLQRECFWVKHYAGKVKYTVEGWVERNMDRIPQSFKDTLNSSVLNVSNGVLNGSTGLAPVRALCSCLVNF